MFYFVCSFRNLRRFRRWQVRQVEAMRCRREWHRKLGVENAGSLDCRFKLNTHKMVFVMNSEDYMYRRGALVKARKVSEETVVLLRRSWSVWWLDVHVVFSRLFFHVFTSVFCLHSHSTKWRRISTNASTSGTRTGCPIMSQLQLSARCRTGCWARRRRT